MAIDLHVLGANNKAAWRRSSIDGISCGLEMFLFAIYCNTFQSAHKRYSTLRGSAELEWEQANGVDAELLVRQTRVGNYPGTPVVHMTHL